MAQVTISQLPQAQPLTGTETVPINQNGLTVQTTVADIANSPTQQQTFITVSNEPTLPNSRRLQGSTGVGLTDTGSLGTISIGLTGAAGSLDGSTNGIIAKTSGSTVIGRAITGSATGVTVTNGDGVAGNPVVALTGAVGSINGLSGSGLLALQSGASVGAVAIQGAAGEIVVANGSGLSGNPTVGLDVSGVAPGVYGSSTAVAQVVVDDKGRITSATNVTITGSTNIVGGLANQIVYQTAPDTTGFAVAPTVTDTFLKWNGSAFVWDAVAGAGTVTSVDASGGTTGMSFAGGPITTAGTLTMSGTLVAVNGGTGQSSYSAGDILYATSSTALGKLTVGSSTEILTSSGTAPQWTSPASITVGNATNATNAVNATNATNATNVVGGNSNQIVYQTTIGTTSFIAAPTVANTFLEWSGSAFQWSANPLGSVTSVDVSGGTTGISFTGGPITTSGTITMSGTLAAANGGTGYSTYTAGDLLYASGATAISKLGIGAGTYLLTSSGSAPQWTNPSSVTVGSASTATTATNAVNVGTTITSVNATFYPAFVDATTGNNNIEVSSGLTYNPSTNTLTATTFAGNATSASTASAVANAATFNDSGSGVASGSTFDGSAARTISYNTIGAPSVTGTNATGTWGISITGSAGSATTATNVTVTADSTNATRYLSFYGATSGNNGTLVDADLTYNPFTNTLTAGTVVATAGISGGTF